jgi:hypothetical protein
MNFRLLEEGSDVPMHIARMIDWYNREAQRQRVFYLIFAALQLILAASIPVVSLLCTAEAARVASGLIGSAILVVAGLQKTLQSERLWTKYRAAYQLLMRESDLYVERAGQYSKVDNDGAHRLLVERADEIIAGENSAWVAIREERVEKKNT